MEPPSPSGSSLSASSSGSSSSGGTDSESDGSLDDGARRFRRVDSDDNAGAVGGRLGLFTRGLATHHRGAPFAVPGGIHRLSGNALVAHGVGGGGGGGGGSGGAPLPSRAGRLAESSKARVRDALLARDPGGYKRALADKYALSAVFSGLDALGAAVIAAREDGRDDVAFVLDDDRRNARRALDEALANPDEAAALECIRTVEVAIAASLDVATSSAEEAEAARAAAHAPLPLWKRVWDLDKDGEVSLAEKRYWVTGLLLLVTAAGCLGLMGLLTESYIQSSRDPSVVLSVDERSRIDLPRFTFCVQGPSFATIDRRGPDGERLNGYKGTIGRPLFIPQYVQLARKPGEPEVARDTEPFDANSSDGVLRELPDPVEGCSIANGSLSVDEEDVCFSCYEMHEEQKLYGGGSLSDNIRSSIDVSFLVYPAYAACLADPDNVKPPSLVQHLRDVVANQTNLDELIARGKLVSSDATPVTATDTEALSSEQLCNVIFFSGVFYPLRRGGGAVYTRSTAADASTVWTMDGNSDQFLIGRHVGSGNAIDLHILPTVVAGGTPVKNKAISHATLPGIPIGAAIVGRLTQVLLMKRIFRPGVQGPGSVEERRYEARVAGYPSAKSKVNDYLQTEVSIAMETFLVETFDRKGEYTFVQYLEQLTGYTANFFVRFVLWWPSGLWGGRWGWPWGGGGAPAAGASANARGASARASQC